MFCTIQKKANLHHRVCVSAKRALSVLWPETVVGRGGLAVVVMTVDHIAPWGSDMDGVQDGPEHLAKRPA